MRRNYSSKRKAIYDMLKSRTDHPSAKTIYEDLKGDYPDLSLGTVYRNIGLFKEDGSVQSVCTLNGEERLDGNEEPHTHLVCTACGRITDLFTEELPVDDKAVGDDFTDFAVEKKVVTYYGKCSHCR